MIISCHSHLPLAARHVLAVQVRSVVPEHDPRQGRMSSNLFYAINRMIICFANLTFNGVINKFHPLLHFILASIHGPYPQLSMQEFTLEELLDDEEILQECKTKNARLIELFASSHHFAFSFSDIRILPACPSPRSSTSSCPMWWSCPIPRCRRSSASSTPTYPARCCRPM